MSEARCPRCDELIGLGCACHLPPAQRARPYEGDYTWSKFGPDALLISSRDMAHIPGACDRVLEAAVPDPKTGWGWIPPPDPALWTRLRPGSPARATEGNTHRRRFRARPGLRGAPRPGRRERGRGRGFP